MLTNSSMQLYVDKQWKPIPNLEWIMKWTTFKIESNVERPLSWLTCSTDFFETLAICPSVEKTTKPARSDVAQLIVLVTNASLQSISSSEFKKNNNRKHVVLPIAIVMKFIIGW